MANAREGDLIENFEGVIFDVKGLVHPPDRIVAFPRFIPHLLGNCKREGSQYRKVYALSERYRFLRRSFPRYIVRDVVFDETLCEVPVVDVKSHYKPAERLQRIRESANLDVFESQALQLAETLKDGANVPWSSMGVSGSILARLHAAGSDIDPIVYGSEDCLKVYSTLAAMVKDPRSYFRTYSQEELKTLFSFRSRDTIMSFEDFVRTESRKVTQGRFSDTDYFIRFVKDQQEVNEEYGDVRYTNVGSVRLEATIADDSESIFTPCIYRTSNVHVLEGPDVQHVEEIASFRGRFCDQARIGERVIAQGKIEHVTDGKQSREYFRLLLGNKPSDFMILA